MKIKTKSISHKSQKGKPSKMVWSGLDQTSCTREQAQPTGSWKRRSRKMLRLSHHPGERVNCPKGI